MKLTAVAMLAALLAAAPAPGAAGPAPEPPPRPAGKLLSAYSQALYFDGRKVGYRTVSIHRLPGGGHRLGTSEFLKTRTSATAADYFSILEEEVDAAGRPRSVECRTTSGRRTWTVTGRAEGDHLALERTVDGTRTEARIPLEDDVTWSSWAVFQAVLGGEAGSRLERRRVVDERLGGLVPDVCYVQAVGRGSWRAPDGRTLTGRTVVRRCGPAETVHLVTDRGQVLRTVGRSSLWVAELRPALEAMDLNRGLIGRSPRSIEGLGADAYRNEQFGYAIRVPPYPFVAHASPGGESVRIADLTDGAVVTVRAAASGASGVGGTVEEALLKELAELAHRQWASRWDDVEVREPRLARLAGHDAAIIDGRARLGCTTHHFRHTFLLSHGYAFLVTARLADRPLSRRPELLDPISASLKLSQPEGRLPVLVSGDRLRVPYYGFELHRPGRGWTVPTRLDGPSTALEIVREDGTAVCVVRVMTPGREQGLEGFVADRAEQVALSLAAARPLPRKASLGGQRALRLSYEGDLLNDRPARCDAYYTTLGERVLAMLLISDREADEARKELDGIREGLRFVPRGE